MFYAKNLFAEKLVNLSLIHLKIGLIDIFFVVLSEQKYVGNHYTKVTTQTVQVV